MPAGRGGACDARCQGRTTRPDRPRGTSASFPTAAATRARSCCWSSARRRGHLARPTHGRACLPPAAPLLAAWRHDWAPLFRAPLLISALAPCFRVCFSRLYPCVFTRRRTPLFSLLLL